VPLDASVSLLDEDEGREKAAATGNVRIILMTKRGDKDTAK
jgi:hypothetical protein